MTIALAIGVSHLAQRLAGPARLGLLKNSGTNTPKITEETHTLIQKGADM